MFRLRADVTAGTTMPPFGWRRAVSSNVPAQPGGITMSLLQNAM